MTEPRICTAINDRQRIQFTYNGKLRIAEPQCYGISTAGKEAVRFFLIEGGSRPEQLFELSKMEDIKFLNEFFTRPGPNYVKNDSAFTKVFCQL